MSGWEELESESDEPSLDTEEGRDSWIDFMLTQNDDGDWVSCQAVHDGENMVARFKWSDGREEVFDMQVRRSMEVVRPAGEEGSN